MKNTRSYRLPALLLAVMMVIGVLPVTAAAGNYVGPVTNYEYVAADASFTFASDGKLVNGIADLDPNKVSTMTVTVPASDGLPTDKVSKTLVNIPENVKITAEYAAACQGEGIKCSYLATTNQLVFRRTVESKEGFTATIQIKPDMPVTKGDQSGSWVLVIKNGKGQTVVVKPELTVIDGVNRLKAVSGEILYNTVYRTGTDLPEWKVARYSGDWYSISYGGKYLNYGKDGNNISLTDTPQYFLYAVYGAGNQFVSYAEAGTRYYLNNKADNEGKGIQASTYDNQQVLLYKELQADAGYSLVKYSVNGGTADSKLTPVKVEKGSTITLPEYKGTKNGYNFIGWSTRSNIKVNQYTQVYQPGETITVDADTLSLYATWSAKNPEKTQFGIRMSGDIPDEPAQYDVGSYSKQHVYKEGAVITGTWIVDTNAAGQAIEGNHVVNSVTANLAVLPTDDEIKIMYPGYDPETMYVHWYVLKYAGQWKVDGVVVSRSHLVEIRYDANVATEIKGTIKNIPASYKVDDGTAVKVGTGIDGKQSKLPTYPEYIFEGWNTAADGSGQAYEPGADYTANEDVTFYAQWSKIPTYQVSYQSGEFDTEEYHAGDKVKLAEAEERDNYLFSGWMINGERIEGDEFIMPEEDVEIAGVYYGPLDVEIVSDWPDGKIGYKGAKITLTAVVRSSYEIDLDYAYQWQYKVNGAWVNLDGATEVTVTYELDEDTSARVWRVLVTDAWPRQK